MTQKTLLEELASTFSITLTEETASQIQEQVEKCIFEALGPILSELEPILEAVADLENLSLALILDRIWQDHTKGLSMFQVEKLKAQAVDVSFDIFADDPFTDYSKKITDLKVQMFSHPRLNKESAFDDDMAGNYVPQGPNVVVEGDHGYISPEMAAYLAVSRRLLRSAPRLQESIDPVKVAIQRAQMEKPSTAVSMSTVAAANKILKTQPVVGWSSPEDDPVSKANKILKLGQ